MGDLIGVGEHADPYANHGVGTFMYMTGSFMGQNVGQYSSTMEHMGDTFFRKTMVTWRSRQ